MIGFWTLCLVLQLVFVKGEPHLEIFKTIMGIDIPISHHIREISGTNFTLTCKLIGGKDDDKIAWGWNRKNVKFSNIPDLIKLSEENSNPLKQFLNETNNNQSTIPFQPLLLRDGGKYFCMSLKYKLFYMTKIRVVENTIWDDEFMEPQDKNAMAFPKSSLPCLDKTAFVCNSRRFCVSDENVCDNIKDCDDGSDENIYLCGEFPCKDKTRCSDGRCISESLCCNYLTNFTCTVTPQLSCCYEIINKKQYNTEVDPLESLRNDDKYIDFDFSKFEIQTMPNFDLNQFEKDESFNEFNIYQDDSNNTLELEYESRTTHKTYIWISVAPLMATMIAIRKCIRGRVEKCRNGSRREILPPCYDEAVINVPQTTSLLK